MKSVVLTIILLICMGFLKAQGTLASTNDKTTSECHYTKKQGQWNIYSNTGRLMFIATFVDDKLNGHYAEYSQYSTQPTMEGSYKNGLREGQWFFYNQQTALIDSIVTYKNGILISKI